MLTRSPNEFGVTAQRVLAVVPIEHVLVMKLMSQGHQLKMACCASEKVGSINNLGRSLQNEKIILFVGC